MQISERTNPHKAALEQIVAMLKPLLGGEPSVCDAEDVYEVAVAALQQPQGAVDPERTDAEEPCPVCGQAVVVITDDDGTSHYAGVDAREVAILRRRLRGAVSETDALREALDDALDYVSSETERVVRQRLRVALEKAEPTDHPRGAVGDE